MSSDHWNSVEGEGACGESGSVAVDAPGGRLETQLTVRAGRRTYAERKSEKQRLADLGKQFVSEWRASGAISQQQIGLSGEVFLPPIPSRGVQFCLFCGKHSKFRLRQHLLKEHSDQIRRTDGLKVAEQISRGIVERMKMARMDFSQISKPLTRREWAMYQSSLGQLWTTGVPTLGRYVNHYEHIQEEPYRGQMAFEIAACLDNKMTWSTYWSGTTRVSRNLCCSSLDTTRTSEESDATSGCSAEACEMCRLARTG